MREKTTARIWIGVAFLTAIILCIGMALTLPNIAPRQIASASPAAAAAEPSFTLNGKTVTISQARFDPFLLEDGEDTSSGKAKIVIKKFEPVALESQNALFTTRFPYAYTPERTGATEYAFEYKSGAYRFVEKKADGGIYIPVNGIVISAPSDVYGSVAAGAVLTKNVTIPDYYGAVSFVGTGTVPETSKFKDTTIRLGIQTVNGRRDNDKIAYYNNEWGKHSDTNEFGTEALCTIEGNEFSVAKIRQVRDMEQLEIDQNSFVLSIHGALRSLLAEGYFVVPGDEAILEGLPFVDLNKSAARKLTAKNPTAPIKPTDLDDLNNNLPFPGYRAPGYLILYGKGYDKSQNPGSAGFDNFTGCNSWGYEVLVRQTSAAGVTPVKGVIVEHDKQVGALLAEGESFILSGNGAAETFLRSTALNGADVVMSGDTVTITTTPASYVTTAVERLKYVNNMMQSAVDAKYALNYIDAAAGDTTASNKWTRAAAAANAEIGKDTDSAAVDTMKGLMKKMSALPEGTLPTNADLAAFNGHYLSILNLSNLIESMSYQTPTVNSIGAWHRPNLTKEATKQQVIDTIAQFKNVNINTIYVETFWNGYTMSAGSAYVDYHKDFKNNTYDGYKDYLDCFISEAHKQGIEVHAWVEDFFVGYEGFDESNILTGRVANSSQAAPNQQEMMGWLIKDFQDNKYTQFEGGKYAFIDPSNPSVRKFLIDYYKELLTNYDLDGINLDYIRYPVQRFYVTTPNSTDVNVPKDHGYSEFAAKKFLSEVNASEGFFKDKFPPAKQSLATLRRSLNKNLSFPDEADKLFSLWTAFKTRQVTEFVGEVNEAVKGLEAGRNKSGAKPASQAGQASFTTTDIIVSTAVFADADVSVVKNQDWFSWIQKGYIEVTTPMAYYQNNNTVEQKIREMVDKISGVCFNYGGIAPYFMGMASVNEVYQVLSSIRGGAFGTVIFDSKTIIDKPEVCELLKAGVYGNPAVTPHASIDKLLSAVTDTLKSRSGLYGITGAKLTAYEAMLDGLKAKPYGTTDELRQLRRDIYAAAQNADEYAVGLAVNRIKDELTTLNTVLDVHLSRMYIAGGWVPELLPRPDQPQPEPPVDPIVPPEGGGKKGCGVGIMGFPVSGGGMILGGGLLIAATCLLVGMSKKSKKQAAKS